MTKTGFLRLLFASGSTASGADSASSISSTQARRAEFRATALARLRPTTHI